MRRLLFTRTNDSAQPHVFNRGGKIESNRDQIAGLIEQGIGRI